MPAVFVFALQQLPADLQLLGWNMSVLGSELLGTVNVVRTACAANELEGTVFYFDDPFAGIFAADA